jgi:hypothetical protein
MSDETTSVWSDIWAKVNAALDWVASWSVAYPKTCIVVAVVALIVVAMF